MELALSGGHGVREDCCMRAHSWVARTQTSHSHSVFWCKHFRGCSACSSIQVPWLETNLTMPKAAKKSTKKAAKKPKATKKAAKKTTKKAKKASPKK
jgi:hypothetical protein